MTPSGDAPDRAARDPPMRFTRARIEAFGYELAPVVVSSAELEERLAPLYAKLRIPEGQLEALTGVQKQR